MSQLPLRIAIIVEELIVAGVALCTVDMASALSRLGYNITLIVLKQPEVPVQEQENLRVVVFEIPVPLRNLTELLKDFDAVVVSNGVALPFGFEAARFTTKPFIVDWLHGEVKARQCPAADCAIAVSEVIFQSMQPSENDLFIPNGIDLSRFQPRMRSSPARIKIIQIAREWKNMQPDLAVLGPQLVAEGMPVDIHVVGKNGLSSEHVTFHGVKRDVTSLLGEADILLHMAHMEPFGMPAIEAMACGTIPIVSKVGGLPYSVIHGVTGYVVEFGDIVNVRNFISDLVQKIRSNDPDIIKMRENGLHRIREHFDILVTARQIGSHIETMSRTLPRRNRSNSYPFSFVAPMLYFTLDRKDQYLAAISDLTNVPDLTEALQIWKSFLTQRGPEWQQVSSAMWEFLDSIYSRAASSWNETAHDKRATGFYWSALLALAIGQHGKVMEFVLAGAASSSHRDPALSRSGLGAIILSLATTLLETTGIEVPGTLLQARDYLQECYWCLRLDEVENWKLNNNLLESLLQAAGHPELLALLEAVDKKSI